MKVRDIVTGKVLGAEELSIEQTYERAPNGDTYRYNPLPKAQEVAEQIIALAEADPTTMNALAIVKLTDQLNRDELEAALLVVLARLGAVSDHLRVTHARHHGTKP